MLNISMKTTPLKSSRRNAKPEGWKCHQCGEIFPTRRKRQKHAKDVHYGNKRIAWNKGLTKETSEIVRHISETFKQHYRDGRFSLGHPMSKASKEMLSKKQSQRINKFGSGGFKDVGWYKVKNIKGVEFTVRGKWELAVANKLNELGILWIRNNLVSYFLRYNRYYNPDFYLPETNQYVEVKGYYSDKDKEKMKRVVECNTGIQILFIGHISI